MMEWIPLVIFVGIQVFGVAVGIQWFRERGVPLTFTEHPRYVFRLVQREERAAYARMMRRTSAVAFRDMGRAFDGFQRTIAKELMPPLQRLVDAFADLRK
jgi:hypothetical protein